MENELARILEAHGHEFHAEVAQQALPCDTLGRLHRVDHGILVKDDYITVRNVRGDARFALVHLGDDRWAYSFNHSNAQSMIKQIVTNLNWILTNYKESELSFE